MNPANLKTEDDARNLWCPHVRHGEGAHNKWTTESDISGISIMGCQCITSECSQWLWGEVNMVERRYMTFPEGTKEFEQTDTIPGRGYCGLTRERM